MSKQPTNPSTWPSSVKRKMLLDVMVTEKTVEELRDEVKACQGRWVLTAKGLDETLDNSALGLLL